MTDITRSQRARFTSIVDLNWEFENERDLVKKWELAKTINRIKTSLKNEVGQEVYTSHLRSAQDAETD